MSAGRLGGEASQFKPATSWSTLVATSLFLTKVLSCRSSESADLRVSSSSSLTRRISSARTIGLSGTSLSAGVNSAILELIAEAYLLLAFQRKQRSKGSASRERT